MRVPDGFPSRSEYVTPREEHQPNVGASKFILVGFAAWPGRIAALAGRRVSCSNRAWWPGHRTAGFADDVIIAKIKSAPAAYKLEIDDLLNLKKAGLSDSVIAAMVQTAGH